MATAAGARDPQRLGRRLTALVEGTTTLSTSLDSDQPAHDAVAAARVLIDNAVPDETAPRVGREHIGRTSLRIHPHSAR
ncbi:hypothetical protein [Streptomyces viridochromogenes]|uniref:hypothetical protein n=1 Tax=Streptomyces viridochromogenes TaxID=1938 RepID=UPI0007C72D5E|nr:hypothetical protein [Streptomyces viridochromogenes]